MSFAIWLAGVLVVAASVVLLLLIPGIAVFGQIDTYLEAIVFYIGRALDIVWVFVPREISIVCMTYGIALWLFRREYTLIRWVLRKIPVFHVD